MATAQSRNNGKKDGAPSSIQTAISLDVGSYMPYYEQIVEQVRKLVRTKQLAAGANFYSEGEVAKALGISKMPVRQAFQKLRGEGLLVIQRGKRPTVGAERVPWDFQRLRGFTEEMLSRGFVPSARVLSIDKMTPDTGVAQALGLARDQKVYRLKRLRLIDKKPVAVVTSFLPCHLFPGLEKHDFEAQSLYHVIEKLYGRPLQRADEIIGAASAEAEDAKILRTSPGQALLVIKETSYDTNNLPIEHSVSLLRGDRYTASVTSVR
jgi:GntR family transcriptional regulator